MASLAKAIVKDLATLKDSSQGRSMSAYMRNLFPFLGVSSPNRKEVVRRYNKEAKNLKRPQLRTELQHLWDQNEREYQYAAIDLYISCKRQIELEDHDLIAHMITTKQWWDTVDLIASHLVGELWQKYPHIRDQVAQEWLESKDVWLNRTCLLYQLKYKESVDTDFLTQAISMVKHKDEFFIQKAIGWALRQHSKTDREYVFATIDELEIYGLARREALKHINKKS